MWTHKTVKSNEKLTSICAGTSISHTQQPSFVMSNVEIFIGELWTVYWNTTSAVMVRKIATLGHKVLNHSVEGTSLISVLLFIVTYAQRSKIFSSLWNIILEKLNFDLTYFFYLTSKCSSPIGAPFFETLKKTRGFFGSETPSPFAVAKVNRL